jgi:hypothetical protein
LEVRINALAEAERETEEGFENLHRRIDETVSLITDPKSPPRPDKSEIYTALAKAQAEMHNADQNVTNEFLHKKYADLASVLDAVRGPLSKNGIALFQITEDQGHGVLGIRTVLAHTSGQTIEDLITMPATKLDPQGIGTCRTYMRRYAILAICGIAGALDDDAESLRQDPDDYDRISSAEVDRILMKADELFGERADAVVAKMLDRVFGLTRTGDIKAGEADVAINQLINADKLMKEAAKKGNKNKKSPKPPEQQDEAPNEEPREPGSDDDKGEGE